MTQPRIDPRRMAVISGVMAAAYVWMPHLMFGGAVVYPWLLGPVIIGGGLAGIACGRWEPDLRLRRSGRTLSKAGGRSAIAGLAGTAFVLNHVLDDAAVPWVVLGCIGLCVGTAAYESARARRMAHDAA